MGRTIDMLQRALCIRVMIDRRFKYLQIYDTVNTRFPDRMNDAQMG